MCWLQGDELTLQQALPAMLHAEIHYHKLRESAAFMGKGHPQACPNPKTTLTLTYPHIPYPIYEPLVELLHGSLELAALELPLLVIPDRLQRRSLPCGCSGEVVNVINPPHVVNSSLPALGKKDKPQLSIGGSLRAQRHLEANVVKGNRKHGLISSFFLLVPSAKIMQELDFFMRITFICCILYKIRPMQFKVFLEFFEIVVKSCLDHCPYCASIAAVIRPSPQHKPAGFS